MKKIGIITFHNAINYGAVLQNYALQSFLNNNDYYCETIDYRCEKFESDYKIFRIYKKNIKGIFSALLKVPTEMRRNKNFKKFSNENIRLSNEKYTVSNVKESNSKYDLFICGSDQVWNLQLTGNDTSYFLDFVTKDKKRISYAASFGHQNFTQDEMDFFKQELQLFDNISIRENDVVEILENNLKKKIYTVLDPVFLLDINSWDKIRGKKKQIKDKYILVYFLHEKSVFEIADKLAKKTGFKIICIQKGLNKPIKAKYILDCGPNDFLNLICEAEYVVTDSFHGASFSIIYKKNLKIVLKREIEKLNGRLISLTEKFQLQECIVDRETEVSTLLMETDYSKNSEIIKNTIDESKQFIQEAVISYSSANSITYI